MQNQTHNLCRQLGVVLPKVPMRHSAHSLKRFCALRQVVGTGFNVPSSEIAACCIIEELIMQKSEIMEITDIQELRALQICYASDGYMYCNFTVRNGKPIFPLKTSMMKFPAKGRKYKQKADANTSAPATPGKPGA